MTGGFQGGEVTILAARLSMRNTDVMLHFAKMSGWAGYLPLVFSLEKVRVYSLKMNKKHFFFIFASSAHEAVQFFTETFQQTPLNCHEYPLEFEFVRGKEVVSFREMRRDFVSFPAIAGRFGKEEGNNPTFQILKSSC